MSPKKDSPKASAWDKISQQSASESNANRDVYENQQLDRSAIEGKKSKIPRTVGAAILGVVAWFVFWTVWSLLHMLFVSVGDSLGVGEETIEAPEYYTATDSTTLAATEYRHIDPDGEVMENSPFFDSREEAEENPPAWYIEWEEQALAELEAQQEAEGESELYGFGDYWTHFDILKLLFVSVAALGVFLPVHTVLMRKLEAQNLMHDTSDINQYQGDQHIALPREVMKKFSLFPDVGAHSDVQPSSMISHVMLTNKGVEPIKVSKRAKKDILDEDGDIEYYKGEILRDDQGNALMESAPAIDEDFGDDLFDASGLPSGKDKDGKRIRKKYNPNEIEYNPEGKPAAIGGKTGSYKTVKELINEDWYFPEYEVQRPAGAYIVDEAPVNTMVLAITRAGKGQTYIEPMIDMWLREKRPNNMVVNDPKGELLVKHYVRATMRGYQVVQFNLINAMKTDIYNPLEMAAQAARAGDITKCAMYVENIADVFFPVDGGEDPVWPNAANNAFKRAAYGLIDFYLEEERELRAYALRTRMDPKVLDGLLDERWGKVTLYNCYQLFVQLTSKKVKNPVKQLKSRYDSGEFGTVDDFDETAFEEAEKEAEAREFMWDGADEIDQLTLYFNATQALPRNSLRDLVSNADNALRAMGAAEKMLASVYGIAITAMSFFTDPTIATLTSGRPSQNVDLAGMSFPRRIGVRFHMNYLSREQFIGAQVKWDAYADEKFEEKLEGDFDHEDIVSREGWARYYFKGIFPKDTVYLRLRLLNSQSGMLLRTFYFRFTKDYQTSLDGRRFVSDPITGEKIVKDGTLVELKGIKADGSKPRRGESFEKLVPGHTVFPEERLVNLTMGAPEKEWGESVAIITNSVRYSEKPKAVFLVTPPHLMKYAKLVLILVKQLVDLNFDQSYMTKSNQKPLYKTRFMLDELGNLQSEGQGISGFETMLSIGLGQEQQFTIILQTLQQLRDVYGESVDKIVQGNAAPLDSLIATPSGWQTMGETEAGDVILTPFGTRTEVTGVFPRGVRPVYRVTLRDGSSSEVCNEHLWEIQRWKSALKYTGALDGNGRREYIGTGLGGRTAERVSEVIDTMELKARVDAGKQIDLPALQPLDYDKADLPLDPYVLGVLLGDAHVNEKGHTWLSCNDEEIIDELKRRGFALTDTGQKEGRCPSYYVTGVAEKLRDLGVAGTKSWQKRIPEQYLYGSVQQRIDLLRGLMDSDGTISTKGEMEFTSSSRELAEGVQNLVRSLGGRVDVNVKTGVKYTSPTQVEPKGARDAFRVQNIRLQQINPFLLPRKAGRWIPRTDNSGNRVVSVKYVRDEEVQCISVADERHLYVMDDYMPTHNTSNIVFLKSTDDSMIETLEKMSGKTHVAYMDSKTVTKDTEAVLKFSNVEGKVSYTMNTKEEPVIKYNDMAFLSERNSIVFRAGDPPVWNRNETILPMSWRLFKDTIEHPGHDYSLQTIPTLSSALEFDVRGNQPDFQAMLMKRMRQAEAAVDAKRIYQEVFELKEADIARLDPDVYADSIMELVDVTVREEEAAEDPDADTADEVNPWEVDYAEQIEHFDMVENTEQAQINQEHAATQAQRQAKIFAEKRVAKEDLVTASGAVTGWLDDVLVEVYKAVKQDLARDGQFQVDGTGNLRSADGSTVYITKLDESEAKAQLREDSESEDSRVYAEDGQDVAFLGSYQVEEAFYRFLESQSSWLDIAEGEFDREVAKQMQIREDA